MAKTDTDGASTAGSGGDTPGPASTEATSKKATSGKATSGKATSRKAGAKKASPKAAPTRTASAKTGTGKNGKNGKNGGKKDKPAPTTSVTTGPGDVTAEVTTPEPVVPAARTAPESRPLAVRHPRKPAPAPRHSESTVEVTTADVAPDVTADAGSEPAGREVALPASSSTVDELSRLAMVPVDVARRVLPERRLPFYLGVGALAVVGVVEWPLAVGASLAWEALRRRPAR